MCRKDLCCAHKSRIAVRRLLVTDFRNGSRTGTVSPPRSRQHRPTGSTTITRFHAPESNYPAGFVEIAEGDRTVTTASRVAHPTTFLVGNRQTVTILPSANPESSAILSSIVQRTALFRPTAICRYRHVFRLLRHFRFIYTITAADCGQESQYRQFAGWAGKTEVGQEEPAVAASDHRSPSTGKAEQRYRE